MAGLGTILNVILIAAGSAIGLFIKKGLPERVKNTIMSAVGLCVMFIGISGVLAGMFTVKNGRIETQYTLLIIFSLVLGAVFGEIIDIEGMLDRLGHFCKRKIRIGEKTNFTEGFVTASLVYCVGAMAIVGALEDGIHQNYSILLSKGIIDGVTAVIFTSASGIGVMFSVFSVILYQGTITVLAKYLSPFMTDALITQLSVVGSVLIFAIGINLLFGKKIKVGNLLPAVLIPVLYYIFTLIV